MSRQEQIFLEGFFSFLNDEQVEYAVIRNYETLPRTVPGTDIDLTLPYADFKRIHDRLGSMAASVGYRIWKQFPKNWSIIQIKFAPNVCTDPQEIVKVDFMLNGLKWLGYDLISRDDLTAHTTEWQGLRILDIPACTLLTLLNSWTYGGRLKEKYRLEYLELVPDRRDWVDQRLRALFGPFSRRLISGLEEGRLQEPPWPVRLRLVRSRWKKGLSIFSGLRWFITGTVRRMVSPPGEFVVVIGPDGTGKSSLVDKVAAECVRMYKRLSRFHHYPYLKVYSRLDQKSFSRYKKRIDEKDEWSLRQRKFSCIASLFRCGYQSVRYLTGYWLWIYPERVKGSLVVGERWCYDLLIDPKSKGINLPYWVRRLVFGICPKPDKVIVVRCDPEVAAQRKGELPAEEIQKQMQIIDRLIVPNRKAYVLDNDGSFETGFVKFLDILLSDKE